MLQYCKLFVRYIISRMDDDKRVSDIINETDVLKFIVSIKSAWRKVTSDATKHCFERCRFPTDDYVVTSQDSDEEFQMLFKEISVNCSSDKYIETDNN